MIVIVENMTEAFANRFWQFVREAGYRPEKRKQEAGEPPRYCDLDVPLLFVDTPVMDMRPPLKADRLYMENRMEIQNVVAQMCIRDSLQPWGLSSVSDQVCSHAVMMRRPSGARVVWVA